jgi:hypothetical protein
MNSKSSEASECVFAILSSEGDVEARLRVFWRPRDFCSGAKAPILFLHDRVSIDGVYWEMSSWHDKQWKICSALTTSPPHHPHRVIRG